jgi:hypothetical protein
VGELVLARVPAIALLFLAQVSGLWAAGAPGGSRWAPVSWAAAVGGVVAVMVARPTGGAVTFSGWECSASQLVVGLAPLAVVLRGLRGSVWSWRRGVTAGVALGTAGAIWGQIACEWSALHVAVHHGGTWLALALACALLLRAAPAYGKMPRSL